MVEIFVRKIGLVVLLMFGLLGCKSARLQKRISGVLTDSFYDNQFTGVLVINPKTSDTLFSYNAEKYFTPASNTKIFTLFSALKFLPDSIPAFKYAVEQDTLKVIGTGNPVFLHSYFKDSTALKMAEKYNVVQVLVGNIDDDKFGSGWAWEDYDSYFSPERSSFPMYGNVVSINNTNAVLQSEPALLKDSVVYKGGSFRRAYNKNQFYYRPNRKDTIEVPMALSNKLIQALWEDLLPGKVVVKPYSGEKFNRVAYSIASDSLYKRMMMVSDNFIAEQLLILSSSTRSDTLSSKKVREEVLDIYLNDLKQKPRWVDGSGLSRYNLFTPMSFVQVLNKLYNDIPRDRLFNLFPVGGRSGTLKQYYSGGESPYVYAKSGTLGNNYSLSGYLLTNSGETLIFSFMNNHYTKPTAEVKQHITTVLEWLRDQY